MKLKDTLDVWLKRPPNSALKRGGDDFKFHAKYEVFQDYLANNLHKEVTKQAIYAEIKAGKDLDKIIWLNDHGPDHIKTVIERASQLLDTGTVGSEDLNAKEVFFLLNAIQVHDIGNFYGRYGHEKKVLDAVREGLTPILFDITETKYINAIAQVHGGKVKYKDGTESKNTIAEIKNKPITSNGYDVRQQLLASILRFADELADDRYRADVATLNKGEMPKGSEVFHAYASCLDTVKVVLEKKTVELHFKIPKTFATRTFGKIYSNGQEDVVQDVWLIDEIYKRVLKMHYERIYCAKFWKGLIDLDNIWVNIEFYAQSKIPEHLDTEDLMVHPEITFNLHDNLYPIGEQDIFTLCPNDLKYEDDTKKNGVNLNKKISK